MKPKKNLIFLGGRILGYRCLELLSRYRDYFNIHFVMSLKQDGTVGSDWNPSLLAKADDLGFPVLNVTSLKDPAVINQLREKDINLVLNAFCDRIIPIEVIELPGMEIINFHYGQLPKYQGRFIVTNILLNEEKKTCVTTHFIDKGIDTGDIIFEDWLTVHPTDTARCLYMRCMEKGVEAFERTLNYYVRDQQLPRRPQIGSSIYYKFEEPNGLQLDLAWDQHRIEKFIRATTFEPISKPWIKIGNRIYDIVARPKNVSQEED